MHPHVPRRDPDAARMGAAPTTPNRDHPGDRNRTGARDDFEAFTEAVITVDLEPFRRACEATVDAVRVLGQIDERDDHGHLRWLRSDGARP